MTALHITLPEALTLSAETLASITGRTTRPAQIAWLKEHGWQFELSADGAINVGQLYAHLRLAGLHPGQVDVESSGPLAGFNLQNVR